MKCDDASGGDIVSTAGAVHRQLPARAEPAQPQQQLHHGPRPGGTERDGSRPGYKWGNLIHNLSGTDCVCKIGGVLNTNKVIQPHNGPSAMLV